MKKLAHLVFYAICLLLLCSAKSTDEQDRYRAAMTNIQQLKTYLFSDGAPEYSIKEDAQGYLWGSGSMGLVRFNGREWQSMESFLLESDRGKVRDIRTNTSKDVFVIVEDGIYRWMGHGFKKFKLPAHENPITNHFRDQVFIYGESLIYIGDKGYGILDQNKWNYHYANFGDEILQKYTELTQKYTYYLKNGLIACTDKLGTLFLLKHPYSIDEYAWEDNWQQEQEQGLYMYRYHGAIRDSLLWISAEDFRNNIANWDNLNSGLCLGNFCLIGIAGTDLFYQFDPESASIEKISLPTGSRINKIIKSADSDAVYVFFSRGNDLNLRIYTEQSEDSLTYQEYLYSGSKAFEKYKSAFITIGQQTYATRDSWDWTGNPAEYLFLNLEKGNLKQKEYPELFDATQAYQDPHLSTLGSIIAVMEIDRTNDLLEVNFLNNTDGSLSEIIIPLNGENYPLLIYGNDNYVLLNCGDRLWRVEFSHNISTNLDFTELAREMKANYFGLISRDPLIVALQSNKGFQFLVEKEAGEPLTKYKYGKDYRLRVYSPTLKKLIFYRNQTNQKELLSLDVYNGTETSFANVKKNMHISSNDRYLVALNWEELLVYMDEKLIRKISKPALIDSLETWCKHNDEYVEKVLRYFSYTLLEDGKIWHNGRSYQLDGETNLAFDMRFNQKYVSELKYNKDKLGTYLDIPAFLYDPAQDSITMFPQVIAMQELDATKWILYVENTLPGSLKLGMLKDDQIFPAKDQPDITLGTDHKSQLYFYSQDGYPILMIKETMYYWHQGKWQSHRFNANKVGYARDILKFNGEYYIATGNNLFKYNPDTGLESQIDLGVSFKSNFPEIWISEGELLIMTGTKICRLNDNPTQAMVSIPWLSIGALRYPCATMPRLKYYQNDILIPVDILNEAYPEKCRLQYKLQGYDEDYQIRAYNPTLEYRKLKPGKYTLEVMAITPDASITPPIMIDFSIAAPLWANYYAYTFYILLILVLLRALHLYRTRRLIAQQKALENTVAVRTAELRDEQQKMYSSLQRAMLIQSSILPLQSDMQEHFSNHFVFFKPRDMVSGDFYWLLKDAPCFYLGLIDCTGHGVPGALIAVTVNSILNYLVKDRRITNPKDILQAAHREIGRFLHQQNEINQQDGFEIALLRIDPDKRKICFAGAKRPLFVYTDKHMIKFTGDRNAIGGLKWHEDLLFNSTSFSYTGNTRLYLFSDGIVDQLHPKLNRKLGSQRWIEMLTQIAALPLDEQAARIESLLQEMLDYSPQRDDITILGVELA